MGRKGRRRRFEEARALKRGFDDGLFAEGHGTLADIEAAADPSVGRDELREPEPHPPDVSGDDHNADAQGCNDSGDA